MTMTQVSTNGPFSSFFSHLIQQICWIRSAGHVSKRRKHFPSPMLFVLILLYKLCEKSLLYPIVNKTTDWPNASRCDHPHLSCKSGLWSVPTINRSLDEARHLQRSLKRSIPDGERFSQAIHHQCSLFTLKPRPTSASSARETPASRGAADELESRPDAVRTSAPLPLPTASRAPLGSLRQQRALENSGFGERAAPMVRLVRRSRPPRRWVSLWR